MSSVHDRGQQSGRVKRKAEPWPHPPHVPSLIENSNLNHSKISSPAKSLRFAFLRSPTSIEPRFERMVEAARARMSAIGTKRTSNSRPPMSAFGGKADINGHQSDFCF